MSTQTGGTSVRKTAFVHKLYSMLLDPKISHLIWWSRPNDPTVFALHPGSEFSHVLTLFFKHGNVSSFVRQLHMYGFHKVFDSDEPIFYNCIHSADRKDDIVWEFKHSSGFFMKGDDSKLSLIKRRSSNRNSSEDTYETHYQAVYSNQFQPVHRQQQHNHSHVYAPQPYSHLMVPQQQSMNFSVHSPSPFQQVPQSSTHSTMSSPHSSYSGTSSMSQQQIYYQGPPPYTGRYNEQHYSPAYHHVQNNIESFQHLQGTTNIKAQHLTAQIDSTKDTVIKIGETLPRVATILQNKHPHHHQQHQQQQQNIEEVRQIEQSFNKRAEDIYSLQKLNVKEEEARKSNEIKFWNRPINTTRQPSVFIDPLNQIASSDPHLPTSSPSSLPTRPFQIVRPHSDNSLPVLSKSSSSNSLPMFAVSRATSLQNRPLPRSIPSDYSNDRSRDNSIPNINQLTSQIRPSILEMNNLPRFSAPLSSSVGGTSHPYNSLSSSSGYSGFSAHSSMSSTSSRNSQSGTLPPHSTPPSLDSTKPSSIPHSSLASNSRTLYLNRAQTPPNQIGSTSNTTPSPGTYAGDKALYRPSLATITDSYSSSSKSSGSIKSQDGNKVKVSSLLSGDDDDIEEQHQGIKRVRV